MTYFSVFTVDLMQIDGMLLCGLEIKGSNVHDHPSSNQPTKQIMSTETTSLHECLNFSPEWVIKFHVHVKRIYVHKFECVSKYVCENQLQRYEAKL